MSRNKNYSPYHKLKDELKTSKWKKIESQRVLLKRLSSLSGVEAGA